MTTAYRVAGWGEWYEPTPGENRGRGPLTFVKLRVHGHQLGAGMRLLIEAAGADVPAVFGVFAKLLELAADEPRQRRDGTIYDHKGVPASAASIAFQLGWPSDAVLRGLAVLVDAGWLELVEVPVARPCDDGQNSGTPKDAEAILGTPKATEANQGAPKDAAPNEDRDREEDKDLTRDEDRGGAREVRKPSRAAVPGGKGHSPSVSHSDSDHGGALGVTMAERVARRLAEMLGVGVRRATERDRLQARSDAVTLCRIVRHVLDNANGDAQGRQTDLLNLASEKATSSGRNKLAMFVAAAKKQWGAWPELETKP